MQEINPVGLMWGDAPGHGLHHRVHQFSKGKAAKGNERCYVTRFQQRRPKESSSPSHLSSCCHMGQTIQATNQPKHYHKLNEGVCVQKNNGIAIHKIILFFLRLMDQ